MQSDQAQPSQVAAEQQTRIRSLLTASAVSVAMLVWLSAGALLGHLQWSLVLGTAAWVGVCAVAGYLFIASGRNLRLKDPGMFMPIILSASAAVLGVAHQLDPQLRTAVLPWLIMAFSFAAFTGRTRNLMTLAGWIAALMFLEAAIYVAIKGYAGLLVWQTGGILGSLLCIAAFCGKLNDRRAEHQKKMRLHKTVLDSMTEAVVSLDLSGRVTEVNRASEQLLGVSASAALGATPYQLLQPATENDRLLLANYLASRSVEGAIRIQTRSSAADSQKTKIVDTECTAAVVYSHKGKAIGQVLVLRDVSEATQLLRKLEFDSSHDELTGLFNRRGLHSKLAEIIQTSPKEANGSSHALLIVDLDQFKIINDTCGHAAGDALLIKVAQTLGASVGAGDLVSRYGGDEFAVVLTNTGREASLRIAEQCIKAIGDIHFEWGGRRFKTGASIGCSIIERADFDPIQIIREADSALYLAKDLGRGRVQMHSIADEQIARKSRELEWACRINDAIELNTFELFAQRVLSSREKGEDYYEVLIRLRERDGSVIAPGEFLPAAERFGLMPAIDRWVVRDTLSLLGSAMASGRKIPKVAINLSAQSIADKDFLSFLQFELGNSPVPVERICFELTETVAISSFEAAKSFIESVRGFGCEFALDDVGAGFNSFNYLKHLSFDAIKIDGHYIRNFDTDPIDRSLVESLVQAANAIGLTTVAEMVETHAVADKLRGIGIDHLQGYVFHRPEPFDQILGFGSALAPAVNAAVLQEPQHIEPTPA